jgi:hypothetical protein
LISKKGKEVEGEDHEWWDFNKWKQSS